MTTETEVTLTNALEKVVGPTFVTLSYAASRVRRLMRPELGCDPGQYAGVMAQYEVSGQWSAPGAHIVLQVLLSLRDTYSVLDWKQGAELPTYNRWRIVIDWKKLDYKILF